uniref:NmrA-like family domain-containing protein 1 n=1 Tax=Callorhinchus milii TaxID=7868 RepID=A0A4W3JFC7_CALMI
MAEMVTVFGADGSEGNEVASALLQDGNFKLRAAVSELASPAAQHLQASGAQTVVVDYNQTSTIDSALRDAHKCFVVTDMDFNSTDPLSCVFICLLESLYSLPARHMDAKACINDYMNEIALPKTEIIVPFYFENFLTTFKPTPSGKDTYKIAIPMGETAMDGISVKQIGPIVTALFKAPERWTGKSCFLSADRLEIKEYGQILSEYLDPKRIKDSRTRCVQSPDLRLQPLKLITERI